MLGEQDIWESRRLNVRPVFEESSTKIYHEPLSSTQVAIIWDGR